jgi:hypothetical protein
MTRRSISTGVFFAVFVMLVLAAATDSFADWKGNPVPSSSQWVYDFGSGWMTVQLKGAGSDAQVMLKKVPLLEEQALVLKYKPVTAFTGFQVLQAVTKGTWKDVPDFNLLAKKAGNAGGELDFEIHFHYLATEVVLISDKGDTVLILDLKKPGPFNNNGFSGDLSLLPSDGDFPACLVTIHSWPPGDPKIGS